jgi:hypothetical protein
MYWSNLNLSQIGQDYKNYQNLGTIYILYIYLSI